MDTAIAYYVILDNQDGSAQVQFYESEILAQEAADRELEDFGVGDLSEGVQVLSKSDLPWINWK